MHFNGRRIGGDGNEEGDGNEKRDEAMKGQTHDAPARPNLEQKLINYALLSGAFCVVFVVFF